MPLLSRNASIHLDVALGVLGVFFVRDDWLLSTDGDEIQFIQFSGQQQNQESLAMSLISRRAQAMLSPWH